jgi:hypothetical protein
MVNIFVTPRVWDSFAAVLWVPHSLHSSVDSADEDFKQLNDMLKKTQEKKKMGEWKDSSIQLKFQIKIYI